MSRNKTINLEFSLYLLAFLVGAGIRFYRLGAAPLSETEASEALQALTIFNQGSNNLFSIFASNPGYIVSSGFLFSLFQSTNFLARFIPALAGSLLVFLPYLFTKFYRTIEAENTNLVRWAGIVLAFGLAISPGLSTLSRIAGSSIVGLSMLLLAGGFWLNKQTVFAGIAFGLALISGISAIIGSLILMLTWLLTSYLLKVSRRHHPSPHQKKSTHHRSKAEQSPGLEPEKRILPDTNWRTFLITTGATIFFAMTLLFIYPGGLGTWASSWPDFLTGWVTPSEIPFSRLLIGLLVYEPLALLFTLFLLIRLLTHKEQFSVLLRKAIIFLGIWAAASLIFLLLYPARQMQDLIWTTVPLYALAALGFAELITRKQISLVSLFEALFILILCALSWHMLASPNQVVTDFSSVYGKFFVIGGIFILGVLTVMLVSVGWSWDIGYRGLIIGLGAGLFLLTISNVWGSTQVRSNQAVELWNPLPAPGQAHLMIKTLHEISDWNAGTPVDIEIVSTVDTPSLRWELRNFPNAQFINHPKKDTLPPIVITKRTAEEPSLSATYRGEDFVWWYLPGWDGAMPSDFVHWFTFRQAPLLSEKIIVWTRSDLFLNGGFEQPLSPQNEDDLLVTP